MKESKVTQLLVVQSIPILVVQWIVSYTLTHLGITSIKLTSNLEIRRGNRLCGNS